MFHSTENQPSIFTLTHSLRSFALRRSILTALTPGSYFVGACAPPTGLSNVVPAVGGRYPPIERSSRRWGAVPPRYPRYTLYTLYIYTFSNNMTDIAKSLLSAVGLGSGSSGASGSASGSASGAQAGGAGRTRCPRGSRRNKSGDCVKSSGYTAKKRCAKGRHMHQLMTK